MEGCGETKTGPRARTGCCPFHLGTRQFLSPVPNFPGFFLFLRKGMFFQLCLLPLPGNASVQELKSHSGQAPALDKSIWSYFYKILSAVWNDMRTGANLIFESLFPELNFEYPVQLLPQSLNSIWNKSLSNKYLLKKCINNSSLRSFQTWFLTP